MGHTVGPRATVTNGEPGWMGAEMEECIVLLLEFFFNFYFLYGESYMGEG